MDVYALLVLPCFCPTLDTKAEFHYNIIIILMYNDFWKVWRTMPYALFQKRSGKISRWPGLLLHLSYLHNSSFDVI